MVRAVLLLVVVAGLVIFMLQNLSPLPLIVLGIQTQPLPLSFWILTAIAAGAFTSLVTAGLFKASNFASAPRRRPSPKRPSEQVSSSSSSSWSSGWSSGWQRSEPNPPVDTSSGYAQSATASVDDWEQRRTPLEEWEDWNDYEEPAKTSSSTSASSTASSSDSFSSYSSTGQADGSADSYSRYQSYTPPVEEREEWEDWDDYEEELADRDPVDRSYREPEDDPYRRDRTDFEVKQEPKTYYQSGSVYSYSYRDVESSAGATEDVYDAEFRVIMPPSGPDVEPPEASEPLDDENEDWGDEDDYLDTDGDKRDRPLT